MRRLLLLLPALALADEPVQEIVVVGRAQQLIGVTGKSSDGTVGPAQIRKRGYSRPGEVLETVPGVIVTQHSGSGKANQFFLRGFNLDHGTDFSITVDGVPINFPTHAHGQGYLDINWISPELVERIDYRKGPYHSQVGDFSSAGSASFRLVRTLDEPIMQLSFGQHQYGRMLAADASRTGGGLSVLWAVDATTYDGPWLFPEEAQRATGLVRVSGGDKAAGWDVTGIAYGSEWSATDQVPRRAIRAGQLSRLDAIDHTDGGVTDRYSLSATTWRQRERSRTEAGAYLVDYSLDLFSNFTYFLDDPDRGDQFAQVDRRQVMGGFLEHRWDARLFGRSASHHAGVQLRHDDIDRVALNRTMARTFLRTTRSDTVGETNLGAFYQHELHWTDRLRAFAGIRANAFDFDVTATSLPANSGRRSADIKTSHAGVAYRLDRKVELYAHRGSGFHSNDARGVTIAIDPVTGDPASPVPPLVRTRGHEVGVRAEPVQGYQLTLTAWELDVASELLFIGDAGNTEATRPSARRGLELANYYKITREITAFADVSVSRARFADVDPAGDRIPGSIERVIAAGVNVERRRRFGSLNLRYFGPRPLIEDDSVRSASTTVVNLQLGHRARQATWTLDVLNLLDSRDDDISYNYVSRLPGEPPEGVADVHVHPVVPREARLTMRRRF